MSTRVSYPVEVKMQAIQMRLAGVPVKEVMEKLGIRNVTQLKVWMKWYRKGELHRLEQPVGKQYSFGKGPEFTSELEKVKAENRFLKQQLDVPKKVHGIGKEVTPRIMVTWMESIKGEVNIAQACAWLGIARSTYYRWRSVVKTKQKDPIVEKIRQLCSLHKFRYGYRKITALLRIEQQINHKRVQRIMQAEQLQCRVRIKKRKPTGQPSQSAEHLLQRQFHAEVPMQKLVTDITYLPFGGKMLYLSSILDLYNGEIVAYTIADKQDTSFVLDTLNQLPDRPGMMLHSDQGSVYTSQAYQEAVKGKGIIMSMSRKGMPADNAPIESFHSTLKSETFYLEGLTNTTTAIVVQTIRDYITYYNSTRIQTKLNNQSPVEFRRPAA
ncbi:IS3 family transposase [Brevibacillus sp. HB1.4B]|uniref:IS3 family transposase n=2 Tax=Brevibacillus TaxID=55080 RepID=UPI000BBFACC5|nr:IS3 family transposase [Brevibacillus sp. HB1.4B]ATF11404.1 IS3 family transposase [Brevibacillus brevis X23]ATF11871.1 IS3 family transposase [Brevibacillus brevis X23]ATF11938.1 IS3 family transposase [Brevibacillus brevis X23]ATF14036.1 IS3 family transposase [Brevibacillus brevis X23]NRS20746.1 IS3 family transposase [Brevibacillus sp. HB1.4B]